jgi:hypothetical protein
MIMKLTILKDGAIAQGKPHMPHIRFKAGTDIELADDLARDLIRYGFAHEFGKKPPFSKDEKLTNKSLTPDLENKGQVSDKEVK